MRTVSPVLELVGDSGSRGNPYTAVASNTLFRLHGSRLSLRYLDHLKPDTLITGIRFMMVVFVHHDLLRDTFGKRAARRNLILITIEMLARYAHGLYWNRHIGTSVV